MNESKSPMSKRNVFKVFVIVSGPVGNPESSSVHRRLESGQNHLSHNLRMRLFFLLWSADSLLIVNSLLRLLIVIIVAETKSCKSKICTISTEFWLLGSQKCVRLVVIVEQRQGEFVR